MLKIFVFALFICSIVCWWELGHMTTAQVAKFYLEQNNKTVALQKFTKLISAFNTLTDGRSNTFIESASWADDIKQYNATFFDSYHFINIVYDPHYMFKHMTDLQTDVNSVNILGWCMTVLKSNKEGITFQRAFMARYLVHLVGDMHQPLHNTNMFNETLKTGDLGGNLISIMTKQGKKMNLHSFLDSMALQQKDGQRIARPLNDQGKASIEKLATQIMKQYPIEYFGDKAANTHEKDWSIQSFKVAVDKIYSYVQNTNQASEQWSNDIFNMCRQRVALGGYRLANVISLIYG